MEEVCNLEKFQFTSLAIILGGIYITLRRIENALLKKEGSND
jgi:hypothetical protein